MAERHLNHLRSIVASSLELQVALVFGYALSLVVSLYYLYFPTPGYPGEQLTPLLWGLGLSLGAVALGRMINADEKRSVTLHLRRGAWTVLGVWMVACSICAVVFYTAGMPDPSMTGTLSVGRRMVDSFYEAMSGFTTTGTTIVTSVEAYPRGVLFWRSMTHWYGGIGLATIALLLWNGWRVSRSEIVNAEGENHVISLFDDDMDVVSEVMTFFKIYVLLTVVLFVLLFISGSMFRLVPYARVSDDVFEAVNYAFSTMGTGGFGIHNASAGLPVVEGGRETVGGLRDPISEWIITIFMFIAGSKLVLWYLLVFKGKWRRFLENRELWVYLGFIAVVSSIIFMILTQNGVYQTVEQRARYTLFNVATLLSTTGLADTDFTKWPAGAQGMLFLVSLVGGMVGSTAGGLKTVRFMVVFQYIRHKLSLLLSGARDDSTFVTGGVRYSYKVASVVMITMLLYYFMFLGGGIAFMLISGDMVQTDGSVVQIDFTTAFTASIANLGNIGPAVSNTKINTGPTGNYYSFSVSAKILMIVMMWVGRVGLLTMFFLFMDWNGEKRAKELVAEVEYDVDKERFVDDEAVA